MTTYINVPEAKQFVKDRKKYKTSNNTPRFVLHQDHRTTLHYLQDCYMIGSQQEFCLKQVDFGIYLWIGREQLEQELSEATILSREFSEEDIDKAMEIING